MRPLLPGRRLPAFPSRAGLQPLLLLVVSGTALALASVSLLLAASSWGRSLCLSRDLQEDSNTGSQPQEHYEPGWNREGFLYRFAQEGKARNRRTANRKNSNRNRKSAAVSVAAHYEVKSGTSSPQAQADRSGIIKDWIEVKLNSTNPLSYNNINGEFKVTKKGLYYLYCQVHFHEGKSIYVKLDISLDGEVAFRCLEEFSTTAASIQEAEVKVCQVSGLVLLQPNSVILIKTIKDVSLKTERYLTYFGLFQVH